MQLVVLGLGSNKKFSNFDCIELLQNACIKLSKLLDGLTVSSVYRSKAMYYENQEDFYNMVVFGYVKDECNPYDFLNAIHKIECEYGRNRELEIRFGPRTLDIDIELFGSVKLNTEILEIPHVRIKERAFVLIPLLEILPKNADENIRKDFENALKKLNQDGQTRNVEKLISASEIKEKIFLKAARNGTKNYSSS